MIENEYPLTRRLRLLEDEERTDTKRFVREFKGMGTAVMPPEERIRESALRKLIERYAQSTGQ